VKVEVTVDGWKGVFEMVGVGVSVGVDEAVPVRMMGVRLSVGVGRLSVSVAVAVMGVTDAVGVGALGSGARRTAIIPRQ
jgi:hypothetical protein